MENVAVWTIVCVVFGMAGFWGGVLQHAHLTAGDGGALTVYPRVLGRNTTGTDIINSGVASTIDIVIPAGVLETQRFLRVKVLGEFLNNTGLAAVPPKIECLYAGLGNGIFFIAGTVASVPTRYLWTAEWEIYAQGSNMMQSASLIFKMVFGVGGGANVPLFDYFGGKNDSVGGIDSSIAQNLTLRVTNQVVNPNYAHRVLSYQVEVV